MGFGGTPNDQLVTLAGTQSLSGKTLVSPTITTSPTAAGSTWADLGAVTTIDINGGTVGGVTLDGTISGTPTWASAQAITVSTAAQASITSVGTLTGLAVGTTVSNSLVGIAGARGSAGNGFTNQLTVRDTTSMADGVGGAIVFEGNFTGTTPTAFAQIAGVKAIATDNNYDGDLAFYTRTNGGGMTERMRLAAAGGLGIACEPTAGNGLFVQNASTNNAISTASQGAATTTLYIGNASINITSDKRVKTDIVPTAIAAIDTINRLRTVDFNWNDPSDTAPVNKNSRGKWTGLIAQDMVDVVPWVVNAPDRECPVCRAGDECSNHPAMWHVDFDQMAGLFVKAFQELDAKVTALGG